MEVEGSAAEIDFFAQEDVSAAAMTSNAKGNQMGAESDSMDLTGSALVAMQTSAEVSAIFNEVRVEGCPASRAVSAATAAWPIFLIYSSNKEKNQ